MPMLPGMNPASAALQYAPEDEELLPEDEEAMLAEEEAALAGAPLDPTQMAGPGVGGDVPLDPSQDVGAQAMMIGQVIGQQADQAHQMIEQEKMQAVQMISQIIAEAATQPMTLDEPGLPV